MGEIINNEGGFNTLDNEAGDSLTLSVNQSFGLLNNSQTPIVSSDHAIAPYNRYTISVEYITDYGVLQLPTAPFQNGGTQACVFVKCRSAHTVKRVTFIAERLGLLPIVPIAGGDQNSNYVALSSRFVTMSPKLTSDSLNVIYRLAGEIVYAGVFPLDQTGNSGRDLQPFVPASGGIALEAFSPQPVPLTSYNLNVEY